jgi:hypothetical protein
MTNDSLNLQVMKINGLNNIATNDSDFDRVDWLKVWKPQYYLSANFDSLNFLRCPSDRFFGRAGG